ncbi:flagellar assembly peptidoglycan hydrolase FlgJ [Aerolutibacter ruishenii]|uniref:Peptidoglycan hydrolase FlgJ n=1 Tax=Aerolutibacter ruishenii TaxID=686800 RepID=A0A562LN23_9GAMM|nr:flagellar assembly peptidoglycan hydrolase FlgJ [Lysobacter ruishenii]TWI09030.1 flagellar protein FlgJ [Lysobacter ruishenii]
MIALPSAAGLPLTPSGGASRERIEKAARELETQFAHMLIKSMRSASFGDPLGGDNTTYREMYDQQLAKELAKGRGLGLAPMIMQQLERSMGTTPAVTAPDAPLPLPGTTGTPAGLPLSVPAAAPMPLSTDGGLALAPSHSGVSMAALPTTALPPSLAAPDAAAACDPAAPLDCSSPEAFVRSVWPHARKAADELGVPAKALVAQAALETGWGRRLVGTGGDVASHNLFGIKAGQSWGGARVSAATHEFVGGARVSERADFRAYGSAAESFADYARLLQSPRYAAARGTGDDVHRFASALQSAGYATDPSYAAKISAIANGTTLRRAIDALPATTRG